MSRIQRLEHFALLFINPELLKALEDDPETRKLLDRSMYIKLLKSYHPELVEILPYSTFEFYQTFYRNLLFYDREYGYDKTMNLIEKGKVTNKIINFDPNRIRDLILKFQFDIMLNFEPDRIYVDFPVFLKLMKEIKKSKRADEYMDMMYNILHQRMELSSGDFETVEVLETPEEYYFYFEKVLPFLADHWILNETLDFGFVSQGWGQDIKGIDYQRIQKAYCQKYLHRITPKTR